jgi:hypothetical protein
MARCQIFFGLQSTIRHHTHYTHGIHCGKPYRMKWDILYLSKPAHYLVHAVAGGTLWMKDAVTRQNKMAKWYGLLSPILKFPNPIQRTIHLIARFNGLFL